MSCFLLPRVLPDGTRNAMRLMRLKDKLGNRSNASAEVEYEAASGWLVGEPGRGVATIIEMVSATRLDCVLGSAAQIRQASVAAAHHAAHRSAFGAALADQPLMTQVLADLALEAEAATALALRLAGAADRAARGDEAEAALLRLALPAAKFWICKRAPAVTAEALECLGGNGYVEDSGLPRLYRDAPLNSIWEGSGNVTALDLLRALHRAPQTAPQLLAEVGQAAGADARLDAAAAALAAELAGLAALPRPAAQRRARYLAGLVTLTLQGSLLARRSPAAVADAFCAARLGGAGREGPGLPAGPGGGRAAVRPAAGRHRPGRRGRPVRCHGRPVKSIDAPVARYRLSARCHLGRVGHELRAVLRGRRAGRAVPVRRRRRRRDPGGDHRGGRLRLALLPAGHRARAASTATGCTVPTSRGAATGATRPSCCSTPTARRSAGRLRWDEALFSYRFRAPAALNTDDSAPFMPRNVVINPYFDWADDRAPRTPYHETLIYEAHVRGLTLRHPDVPPEAARHLRGAGLARGHRPPDPARRHRGRADAGAPVRARAARWPRAGLANYWGYNTIGFFAPHNGYSAAGEPHGQVAEFKAMVKALHAAGIEVILDVVYNHTAEGGALGPTLSFRGIDNAAYYRLADADPSALPGLHRLRQQPERPRTRTRCS